MHERKLAVTRDTYWASTRHLTGMLLIIWAIVTFGVIWFAEALNRLVFIGPLGFYMAGQGALLIYLAIIGYYTYRMDRLDAEVQGDQTVPTVGGEFR